MCLRHCSQRVTTCSIFLVTTVLGSSRAQKLGDLAEESHSPVLATYHLGDLVTLISLNLNFPHPQNGNNNNSKSLQGWF